MTDISQNKIACANLWLYSGQRVQPCCVVCGREFGKDAQRCAGDLVHCVICRHDYDRYQKAEYRRRKIPALQREFEKLIEEEQKDPSRS